MAIDAINRDRQKARPVRDIGDDGHNILIDDIDANTQYIGKSENIGDATSVEKWAIKKIVTSGTVTSTLYANGDPFDVYNKEWDERANYSYS